MTLTNSIRSVLSIGATFFFLLSNTAAAQDAENTGQKIVVRILHRDGTSTLGQVEKVGKDTIVILDDTREKQFIEFKNIEKIDYLTKQQIKQLAWYENPYTFGYLFAPAAFRLEPGEISYKNTYLFLNTFNIGITKRLSMGVTAGIPGVNPFSAHVKTNVIKRSNFNLSSGVSYIYIKGDAIENYNGKSIHNFGFIYSAGTWGDRNRNITIGAGYLLISNINLPISFLAAGVMRVSKKIALISDNWFFFQGTGFPFFFSYGIRLINRKSIFEFAFINNSEFGLLTPIGIPYISYSIKIADGSKK